MQAVNFPFGGTAIAATTSVAADECAGFAKAATDAVAGPYCLHNASYKAAAVLTVATPQIADRVKGVMVVAAATVDAVGAVVDTATATVADAAGAFFKVVVAVVAAVEDAAGDDVEVAAVEEVSLL